MKPVLGSYHSMALWLEAECRRPFSFLDERWTDLESWRTQARARVRELLAYEPPSCPLEPAVDQVTEEDGLVTELVTWAQPFGPRTEAFVVRPAAARGRLPAVVALHDHSAFKYYGKEKLVAMNDEAPIMREFKQKTYGGVSWANELARRGFVVVVPDNFLWGSRKLPVDSVPDEYGARVREQPEGTRAHIEAYNELSSEYESLVAKTLFLSGATWTGIMAWEDRRAVDYLLTRADTDPSRVGCGGLSGGGLRTIYLAALDPRVHCAVCAGFMSTMREMIPDVVRRHTWMFHVPHLAALMDLPDVASLHGPAPLMILGDRDDELWTLAGQEQADQQLSRIYARMGAPHAYQGRFYPGPHKFDLPMQNDAFDWFQRWLS
jgi:dienelactone hydrolase